MKSSDNTTTYLVIDHNLLIVLLVALHAQIFAITAQHVSSTLAFDAFCACFLCPMNAALPQSVTEKSTAWILRLSRDITTTYRRRKQADGNVRFIRRCCRPYCAARTRVVRTRDAARGRVSGGGLVLGQTARLESRGGRSGRGWWETLFVRRVERKYVGGTGTKRRVCGDLAALDRSGESASDSDDRVVGSFTRGLSPCHAIHHVSVFDRAIVRWLMAAF